MAILYVGCRYPGSFSTNQVKFLIIAVDYFTKWVEAELVVTITPPIHYIRSLVSSRVLLPTWNKEVLHFGQVPIDQRASRLRQQSGAQRLKEAIRRSKRMMDKRTTQVLWLYHTIPYSIAQETPFRLTFDMNAMILVEIEEPFP
ncbi:hypothetical protein CR513_11618, partial [Mucuna pruriens]